MEQLPMYRFGYCLNCKIKWDDGDIFEKLNAMDVHFHKTRGEVEKIAAEYGWTPENKKRFSKVEVIELTPPTLEKITLFKCPECNKVYEESTSKEFSSVSEAKEYYSIGMEKPEN